MPSGPVDFSSGQQSSNESLAGAIPRMFNVLVDATGAIHLRPGISAWADFAGSPLLSSSTSVDGIGAWNGYPIWATSDRLLHAHLGPGDDIDISSASDVTTQLDGPTRPVFASTRDQMIVAGGGALQTWGGIGGLSARLGGSPPPATHVVAIATVLVVNPVGLSGTIQWSASSSFDPTMQTWSGVGTGQQELESDPDPLDAVYANTGELIGFGTRTVQTMDPDPNYQTGGAGPGNLFLAVRSWTQGIAAPYSFAQNDEQFGFLDALRRIQLSDGRQYNSISDPALTSTLDDLPVASDCWGFRMKIGSWDLLGWNFPTAGRTFVWDTGRKQWSEWGGFAKGLQAPWMAKSHYFWADGKVNLIGLGDGTIAKMDPSVGSDMGEPVVGEIVSGFQDFGSDLWKQSTSLRLYFRRGLGAFNTARPPRVQVFWRNDTGAWQGPIERDLGTPGDQAPVIEIRGMGMYKVRQWRLRMSDSVPLSFIRAVETYDLGEI